MTAPLHGVAPLPHLGIIAAEGEEAAKFLHAQLTNDFALMPPGQARLAAFCNAKGRMQASFVALRLPDGSFALVTSADLLAQTLKRLSMFVLRTKARLSDATARFELLGLVGDPAVEAAGAPLQPWRQVDAGPANCVGLYPADGQPRALWLAPAGTPAPAGPPLGAEQWRWTDVRSGVANVTAPVYEAFVPQMLNYESVGGVNFKKGCYPGQEVVARSQFRGTLKRRAFVAHADTAMVAGMELFHEGDPGQPCGLVAQGAPAPGGGSDAIVSIQLSATTGGRISVGSGDGAALQLLPLPYELLADI